jgi:peptidoglycan/xylan/chitin deacetylase (PgdA/CDA1 family)
MVAIVMSLPRLNFANRRLRLIAILCLILGLAVFALLWLRQEADGFENLFSANYWAERSRGEDLYNPAEKFFKRGSRRLKEVCLTIDDGPHIASIGRILEVLHEQHVPATFFVVGSKVKQHPEFLRQMIEDGDEIGNHTEDHLRLDTLSPEEIRKELGFCEENVERACGHRMHLMRPPGMRFNAEVLKIADEMGYTIVGWNIGAKDFIPKKGVDKVPPTVQANLSTTPSMVAERVLKQAKNGVIILLHDEPTTADALPLIIDGLRADGYEFVSATEMMEQLPQHVVVQANPPIELHATTTSRTFIK